MWLFVKPHPGGEAFHSSWDLNERLNHWLAVRTESIWGFNLTHAGLIFFFFEFELVNSFYTLDDITVKS